MRAAVLLVPVDDVGILGVEEQDPGVDSLPVELIDGRQSEASIGRPPGIDHYRQSPPPLRHLVVGDRLGEEFGGRLSIT